MFGEEKHLKDSLKDTSTGVGLSQGGIPTSSPTSSLSYTKTDKLITALYMVTDIIDKDEPLRNKLRTLGTGILSDMHLLQQNSAGNTLSFISYKISEVLSFLDLASAVNIISEMNTNILRKEFSLLNKSILELADKESTLNRRINLVEFFAEDGNDAFTFPLNSPHPNPLLGKEKVREISKGHTSIGVQKGSTLMRALRGVQMPGAKMSHPSMDVYDMLKKQRQDSIISIIKTINGGATIKDIKDKVQVNPKQFPALVSCGEKTLQRELVSMVKNGVLDKTGEKRWSKYFLK